MVRSTSINGGKTFTQQLDEQPAGTSQATRGISSVGLHGGRTRLDPKVYNGHNKTFWTMSLERDHDPRELTRQARVPTEAERQGDFSQTLNRLGGAFAIYDPDTSVVSGSTVTRQPFPGARIPANRISPIGSAVLSQYPTPNLNVPPQLEALNWAASKTYAVDQKQLGARIDHNVSSKQRLFGRFGLSTGFRLPRIFSRARILSDPGGTDLGALYRRRVNVGIDDTYVSFAVAGRIGSAERPHLQQ